MKKERFGLGQTLLFSLVAVAVAVLCTCLGSVHIPLADTVAALWGALGGRAGSGGVFGTIILSVRLPRVLCVALTGAALALCGAAMQGLLRNPLADGSTLGVSSGASLGAVFAMATGFTLPGLPLAGAMALAVLFAFLSLVVILALAYRIDHSLATNTIILIGVIFSMFAGSLISLILTFSGEKLRSLTFWMMGSLAQSSWQNALALLCVLTVGGAVLMRYTRELNAFAVGEDNARHVGVNVKRVKLVVMVAVSCLVGVCVAIGGTIGFVGLVIPHMARMAAGPNHRRLMPLSLFAGAIFLMLADLAGRVVLRPLEVPIGVVTSFIGSMVFVYIFYTTRRRGAYA